MHHSFSPDGIPDRDGVSSPLGPLFLLVCLLRQFFLEDGLQADYDRVLLYRCLCSLIVPFEDLLERLRLNLSDRSKKDRPDCTCEFIDLFVMARYSKYLRSVCMFSSFHCLLSNRFRLYIRGGIPRKDNRVITKLKARTAFT